MDLKTYFDLINYITLFIKKTKITAKLIAVIPINFILYSILISRCFAITEKNLIFLFKFIISSIVSAVKQIFKKNKSLKLLSHINILFYRR